MTSSKNKSYSVKEISDILKACFENPAFSDIRVYGEIYSIKLGRFSYVELGDQGNKQTTSPIIKCAFSVFYGNDYHLEELKVGDVIEVRGSLSYYPHGSSLTLWGKEVSMLQSQLGKNLLLKRKTLEKLEKLGYLDESRKKQIPQYCQKVAILTAETGAAYQDILKTLHDRFPVNTVLFPIVVQGPSASSSIVKAFQRVQTMDFDAVILGRGGGSKTDLACFDDEKVALAIAQSPIPVITCIGHTIDTAIADRVSDKMAITPTEGASLINPSLDDIKSRNALFLESLGQGLEDRIQQAALNLDSFKRTLESLSPMKKVTDSQQKIVAFNQQLSLALNHVLTLKYNQNQQFTSLLDNFIRSSVRMADSRLLAFSQVLGNYNPESLKAKGYSYIYRDGVKINSISQLEKGDLITIVYTDGRKEAKII
ncbi:MAG: exodeoxyribonuclease VII large subunit [Bacilli bacterium]